MSEPTDSKNEEIEAHKEVLAHVKRFLMVKLHEIQTEILRLESASHDPTKVFGNKV
jgi:hypothetical protein